MEKTKREIKKASEALSKSAQVVGMKMYQTQQQSADKQSAGKQEDNADKKSDDPIEGEVVK